MVSKSYDDLQDFIDKLTEECNVSSGSCAKSILFSTWTIRKTVARSPSMKETAIADEVRLALMRKLAQNPNLSQRQLAALSTNYSNTTAWKKREKS